MQNDFAKGIMMDFSQLGEEQLQALQEMSITGMDNAATALSQLMERNIHLKVPRVLAMDAAQVPEFLGTTQFLVIGVYIQILGDARGNIMMVFTRENAMQMLDNLLSRDKPRSALLNALEVSAMKEVGNILASAYLNALGKRLKMTLIPSVPVLSFDMTGAVVDFVLNKLGELGDLSFMIETEFAEDNDNFSGHFFLLPDHASLDIILSKISVCSG
jgi:chemotaxis protein CheC